MLIYTSYANQKFELLNKHQVYITKEQVEDTVLLPETHSKKGKNQTASKEGLRVIYSTQGQSIKILTFYPIKS
jgi:hypothetical protein